MCPGQAAQSVLSESVQGYEKADVATFAETLCKRCDRSHDHARCQGTYTKNTQSYTPEIVKHVHQSINVDSSRRQWPQRWNPKKNP